MPGDKNFTTKNNVVAENKEEEPKIYRYYHDDFQEQNILGEGRRLKFINGKLYTQRCEGDQQPTGKFPILVYTTEKGVKDEISYFEELSERQQKEILKRLSSVRHERPSYGANDVFD